MRQTDEADRCAFDVLWCYVAYLLHKTALSDRKGSWSPRRAATGDWKAPKHLSDAHDNGVDFPHRSASKSDTSNRGFASMDDDEQREIASKEARR